MRRVVRPELLDALPVDDPRAVHSRADLRRINAWMGHARALVRLLREAGAARARRIVELGSGDGRLLLDLAQRVPFARGSEVVLVDMAPVVSDATLADFARLGVVARVEAREMLAYLEEPAPSSDLVVANLVLHHFEDAVLVRLFAAIARRASACVALEPRRGLPGACGSRLLALIGCNDVTRHDARVSVDAGFRARELSTLWPRGEGWTLREHAAGAFSHAFVARRGAP